MKVFCTLPQNGVFFAGELFTCQITLTNDGGEGGSLAASSESTLLANRPSTTKQRPSVGSKDPNQSTNQADTTASPSSYLGGLLRGFLSMPSTSAPPPSSKQSLDNIHTNQDLGNSANDGKPPLAPKSLTSASIQATSPIMDEEREENHNYTNPATPGTNNANDDQMDSLHNVVAGEEGGTINLVSKPTNQQTHFRSISNTPTVEAADFDTHSHFGSPDRATPSSFRDISSNFGGDAMSTVSSRLPLQIPSTHGLHRLSISTANCSPNTGKVESIAMGFAQMTGQFTIDSHFIKKDSLSALRDRVLYRIPGTAASFSNHKSNGLVYGGGSLSTNVSHHEKSAKPINDGLPLYNTPPTILFCDLKLGVGESKTFKYEILLPAVLPPSHRGKVVRFHYKLVIGVQHNVMNATTRVLSVPFRFFNRTNPDGSRPVFELLNPVIHSKDQAIVTDLASQQEATMSPRPSTSFIKTPQLLMDAGNNISPVEQQRTSQVGDSKQSLRSSAASRLEREFETSSADNVMSALQLSGKVSYDICKNNEHIAQLVLGRLGYRLGESVTAILNFTKSTVPCFHVSVFLEVQESVESLFSTRPKELVRQHTRICVGEFHQHTINSRRTAIVLNIPAKATPDFQSSAVSNSWSLRFEFITGSDGGRVLSSMAQIEGYLHQKSVASVGVEPFDCTIPLKVYGALKVSKQQKKVFEFEL